MRLDELRDKLDEASDEGAPPERTVLVMHGNNSFFIDRVEFDGFDDVRIYLEE